jgi:hypothetical protein
LNFLAYCQDELEVLKESLGTRETNLFRLLNNRLEEEKARNDTLEEQLRSMPPFPLNYFTIII